MKSLKTGWGTVSISESEIYIRSKARLIFARFLKFDTVVRRLIGTAVGLSLFLIVVQLTYGSTMYRLVEILQLLALIWLVFAILAIIGMIFMVMVDKLGLGNEREVLIFGEKRIPLSSIIAVKYESVSVSNSIKMGYRVAIKYAEGDSEKVAVMLFTRGMESEKSEFLEFLEQNGVLTEEMGG